MDLRRLVAKGKVGFSQLSKGSLEKLVRKVLGVAWWVALLLPFLLIPAYFLIISLA